MMNSKQVISASLVLLLLAAAPVQAGAPWTIDWWTVDAGGEMVTTGGVWTLSGTVGQWDATDANRLTGQNWTLTGGFWAGAVETAPQTDALFSDRFEL
jgi:hypothetical protein